MYSAALPCFAVPAAQSLARALSSSFHCVPDRVWVIWNCRTPSPPLEHRSEMNPGRDWYPLPYHINIMIPSFIMHAPATINEF